MLEFLIRYNEPAPKRLHVSESHEQGKMWMGVHDRDLQNPGSGANIVGLANGHWLRVYKDTEPGRHSLAVSISTDEGKIWAHLRHLELYMSAENPYSSHYPAVIQGKDGTLRSTYSHYRMRPAAAPDSKGSCPRTRTHDPICALQRSVCHGGRCRLRCWEVATFENSFPHPPEPLSWIADFIVRHSVFLEGT